MQPRSQPLSPTLPQQSAINLLVEGCLRERSSKLLYRRYRAGRKVRHRLLEVGYPVQSRKLASSPTATALFLVQLKRCCAVFLKFDMTQCF